VVILTHTSIGRLIVFGEIQHHFEKVFKNVAPSCGSPREARAMLNQGSIKALIGLIEVRLRCLEITDREDKREKRLLESCRDELGKLLLRPAPGLTVPNAI
jgi:hypothetical protein